MDILNIARNINAPVYIEKSVSSTNDVLKTLAKAGAEHGTVLLALEQTAGRGRLGRKFESPNEGIYLSMLLRPERNTESLASLTPSAAVAVAKAIEFQCAIKCEIKWPNDLLLNGKKICGILTETAVDNNGARFVILGVGLNVNTEENAFSDEVRKIAGSVYTQSGKKTDINALIAREVKALDEMYDAWLYDNRAMLPSYRSLCSTTGKAITVLCGGEGREALALGIDDDYSLIIKNADGVTERLRFGEVSVRSKN